MKISELEDFHDVFTDLEEKIQLMLVNREFPGILSVCVESLPSIVPSIQYRKKRNLEPEMPNLLAFDVICKYAPPLFEHYSLTALFEFVKSTRQLSKHENDYIEMVETALAREETARLLWNNIEQHPKATEKEIYRNMSSDRAAIREIIKVWEELSLIFRTQVQDDFRLNFLTRLNSEVEGVCPNCGVRGKGFKGSFFKSFSCQKCGVQGHYHIIYMNQKIVA